MRRLSCSTPRRYDAVSALYVRQDVIVTGFPTGALGVWLVSHVNDKGVPAVGLCGLCILLTRLLLV
jgi:hypothetical protein